MPSFASRLNRYIKDYLYAVTSVPRGELYDNSEKDLLEGFCFAMGQENFQDRFLALIAGLPEEDIDTVARILKRAQYAFNSRPRWLDLFTETEKSLLRKRFEEFDSLVMPISPTKSYYKGHIIYASSVDPTVFWEKHCLGTLRNPTYFAHKDIIDAGACRGDSAIILSPYTSKNVISFEPSLSNFEILKEAIEINAVENSVFEHSALGKEAGTVSVHFEGDSGGSTTISSNHSDRVSSEIVEVIRLDDYATEHGLDIGLIKMDVEGSEQDLLAGARSTLEKNRPTLIISIYHSADDFFGIKPLIESWNLGYKFRIIKPVNYSAVLEATLIAEIAD